MPWGLCMINNDPPLFLEIIQGQHAFTHSENSAFKLNRKADALLLIDAFVENCQTHDLDVPDTGEVWVLQEDATPGSYLEYDEGFVAFTTNDNAALQFASSSDATRFAQLLDGDAGALSPFQIV